MKFIIVVFLITILLRMVMRYILPIFRITSAASSQMRQMQEKMKEMEQQMNQPKSPEWGNKKAKKEGDYIEYEEVNP